MIISMTTIPPRFDKIGATIKSLENQSARVEKVLLYIPRTYHRFADYDGWIPSFPDIVDVRRVDHDQGPATKILPAIQDFQDAPNTPIIYCDDDRIYPRKWLESFQCAASERPDNAVCKLGFDTRASALPQPRAHKRKRDLKYQLEAIKLKIVERNVTARMTRRVSGYIDIMEGSEGVMVRPGFFDEIVQDVPPESWFVDDIWLSAAMARAGVDIWMLMNEPRSLSSENGRFNPLTLEVVNGLDRSRLNQQAIGYCRARWGIWPEPEYVKLDRSAEPIEIENVPTVKLHNGKTA